MLLNQKSLYCLGKLSLNDKSLEKKNLLLSPKMKGSVQKPISMQNIQDISQKDKYQKQPKSNHLAVKHQIFQRSLTLSSSADDKKQVFKINDKGLRDTDDSCHSLKKKQINIRDFKCLKQLGRGRHGKVFLAIHKETGFIGAMKVFSKQDFRKQSAAKRNKMQSQLIKQLKIQSYLVHSNIIKVYSVFSDRGYVYLFMELGSDGQLYQILQNRITLKEESISFIFRCLLAAVQNLHQKDIIHRDLKPENIVLIHGFPKICDFGQSSICIKQKGELRETLCGTPLYLSPEMLQGERYNEKIDIWALGAMAYELFTGQNPFNVTTKEELRKIVTESFQMKSGSLQLCNFITFCLKKNPMERPSASKLLKHPFIKKWTQLQTSEQLCH